MFKRLWFKIVVALSGVAALGLAVLALMISHNTPCPAPAALADGGERMTAIMQRCYGSADVLRLETVARPTIKDDEVLVRVHAASVNPLDKHYLHGTPYLLRLSAGFNAPESPLVGVDMAGVVEAVGSKVTRFKPGDAVYGAADGAFGEFLVRRAQSVEAALALKPASLSFEQAAAMPIAAITALQALRDKAQLKPGQTVLINGASGGVGTFAVQLAKAMGAQVTGVSSGRNVDLVRSIGADQVIDYTQLDFTQGAARFDVIIDMVGNHSLLALRKVMKPEGVAVLVGSAEMNNWWGPLGRPLRAKLLTLLVSQRFEPILASADAANLEALNRYVNAGQLTPVIDRRYSLAQVPEAIGYLETGRARGKIVINVIP